MPVHAPFPPEVKAEALRLRAQGVMVQHVCQQLHISQDVVFKWQRQARKAASQQPDKSPRQAASQLAVTPATHAVDSLEAQQEATVVDLSKRTHNTLALALDRAAGMSADVGDFEQLTQGLDRLARAGRVLHRYGEDAGPRRINIAVNVQFAEPATSEVIDVQTVDAGKPLL